MSQIHPFFHKILAHIVDQDTRELLPDRNLRLNALLTYLKSSLAKEEERSKEIDQTFSQESMDSSDFGR